MKSTIATFLLAASSAFAAPADVKRQNHSIQITDFWAQSSNIASAYMHFVVTDSNYPDDTPTDCNLIWTYGSTPKESARCNNSQYYIKFPQGPVDFNLFTLGLERVSGPIAEEGQILLSSNANGGAPGTKWICEDYPQSGVAVHCAYDGVLEMGV
ncbi:hypothetical protein FQN54_008247 [Arachnomyces sp. PD_36]|nr:hypothetical protein FQN54_008247 [Arachnomyces sp. PD_36]